MATLRNVAINALRLIGTTNIAAALPYDARDPIRLRRSERTSFGYGR